MKILGTHQLKLTRQQTRELAQQFKAAGDTGESKSILVIGSVATEWGSFKFREGAMTVAVLDRPAYGTLQALITGIKQTS